MDNTTTMITMENSTNILCENVSTLVNGTLRPCQLRPNGASSSLQTIFSVVVTVAMAIIMVGIGCAVDIKKVVRHFKNPTGILTGFACQFVIMPVLAFIWAKILAMDPPETLALLIVGSCPGGTLSNIVAYWIGGDMELSATMTTVSVTASLGMLPLLLFIYSKAFGRSSISVPFEAIGITLALIIGPITIGSLLRFKFPKVAAMVLKICSVVGILTILVVMSMSIYIFHPFLVFHVNVIVIAVFYPLCGMVLGYGISSIVSLIAKPLRLTHRQRRTVSVETGIQNQQVSTAIIQLSGFPLYVTGRMIMFPMMYAVSQIIWSMMFIALFHVVSFARNGRCPDLRDRDEEMDELTTATSNPAFDEKE